MNVAEEERVPVVTWEPRCFCDIATVVAICVASHAGVVTPGGEEEEKGEIKKRSPQY